MVISGDKLAYSRILGNLKRFPNSFPENDNRGLDGFFQNSRKLIKGFRKRFPNTFRVYYVFVFGSVGNPKRVSYSNNLGNPLRISDSTEIFYSVGGLLFQNSFLDQKHHRLGAWGTNGTRVDYGGTTGGLEGDYGDYFSKIQFEFKNTIDSRIGIVTSLILSSIDIKHSALK